MAGSTAIGSASVILSANADGLAAGFDAAMNDAKGFARDVGRVADRIDSSWAGLGKPDFDLNTSGIDKAGRKLAGLKVDPDTSGLDRAEGRAKGFAARIADRFRSSGVGRSLFGSADGETKGFLGRLGGLAGKAKGLLGPAAFAGVGGFIGSTLAAGIMKGFEVLAGIPDLIRGLAEKATGEDAGPLRGIVAAMDKVQAIAERVGGRFFAAFGPGIVAVTDVAGELAERFDGLIQKVGAGLGAAFTVGVELAGALLTAVGELLESFIGWAAGLAGVSDSTEGMSQVVFAVFRGIGKAAAYTWDVFRAGAGAVAWVAGKIVEGLGAVVESFRGVVDLAKALPDSLRPDWVDSFSDAVGNAGRRIREVGEGISGWGRDAVMGFGDSARQVDAWMDGVERRFRQRRQSLDRTAAAAGPTKLAGALQKGSQEAYSAVVKFNTNAMVGAVDPAREALRKQDETNRLLQAIARGIAGAAVLRTV